VRNNPANMKVREGGGGAPGIVAEIPLPPKEGTTVEQTSTLQPVEDPILEQVDMS